MNICYLCRTFHQYCGGTESYVYHMAQAFAKRGCTVHIVVNGANKKFHLDDINAGIKIHDIDFTPEPFRGSWRIEKIIPLYYLRYAWAAAKKMKEILETYPVDIMEAPDWGAEAYWYVKNREIPVCVRLHGYHGLKEDYESGALKRTTVGRVRWHMERSTILRADYVTSVSLNFAELAKKIWKLKTKKIEIIPNGIDQEMFKPNDQVTRELSVLFVGRLEETKGIAILANAIPQVLKKFPGVKFYFAGRNMQYKQGPGMYRDLLERLAPKENLIFLDQLPAEELISYYQKCAIGVFPSLYEPLGTVALESMACGCATIATNAGGFTEIITNGEDGILVAHNDSNALARTIIELLSNNDLRKKISQRGIVTVSRKFNFDSIFQRTMEAYSNAIDNFKHQKK